MLLKDQLMQFTLGHYSIGDVKSGVLPLRGTIDIETIKGPIIELAPDFEF